MTSVIARNVKHFVLYLEVLKVLKLSSFSRRYCHPEIVAPVVPPWMKMPETFEGKVIFPPGGQRDLPVMPKAPTFEGEDKDRQNMSKRLIEIRGPELYHNELIHKQFGMVAIYGSMLTHKHIEKIRNTVNHYILTVPEYKEAFAIWRIDPPWLPRTKRGRGVKMGGGKGKVHHYVTPYKSGRVIFEIGGKIVYDQGRQVISQLADCMPSEMKCVSYEEMQAEAIEQERLAKLNKNSFSYQYCMKWNMHNCSAYLRQYDYKWGGRYV